MPMSYIPTEVFYYINLEHVDLNQSASLLPEAKKRKDLLKAQNNYEGERRSGYTSGSNLVGCV